MAWGKNNYANSVKEKYTKISNDLIVSKALSPLDKIILFYLFSLPEDSHPSVRRIADAVGVGKNTVQRCVTKLISLNIIQKHNFSTKPEITINPTEGWAVPETSTRTTDRAEAVPFKGTGQYPKLVHIIRLKELFKRQYPKREGLQLGLSKLEKMSLSVSEANSLEIALQHYNHYVKSQKIDEKFRLSLSNFLAGEWRSFSNSIYKKPTLNWGNSLKDGGNFEPSL